MTALHPPVRDAAPTGDEASRPGAPAPGAPARVPMLSYSPAIDGLRAVAVAAVVAYHLDKRWAVGGFLGVEVFLVISGFLITALMLAERERTGRIDLRQFWLRRARRLLPALFATIAGVAAFMAVLVPGELADIRDDVVAAFFYVTNWFLTFSDQSYFEALGRPSPLQHLWSLAVEEQWYLVWPIVFAAALGLSRGRIRPVAIAIAAGAVASTALMAALYEPGVDPSRIYYGTDTRAAGLLLGSLLALLWSPWKLPDRVGDRPRAALDVAATAGVVGLLIVFWRLDEFSSFLYRGGFAVVGLLTCLVIAAVAHPAGTVWARVLGTAPFVWIGKRSYGIYLWHWPIIVFSRPRLDVDLAGWQLDLVRIGATLAVAAVSYRLIEQPIRTGALHRAVTRYRALDTSDLLPRFAVAAAAVVFTGSVATLGITLAVAEPEAPDEVSTADVADLIAATTAAPTSTDAVTTSVTPTSDGAASTSAPATTTATPATTAPPTTVATTTTTEARLPRRISVTGDSVAITMELNFPRDLRDTFTVRDAAIEGCGVIEQGSMLSGGRARRDFSACTNFPQRWAESARAQDAELVLVVLGAWEMFDLRVDGVDIAFGTPEHDAIISGGVRRGVDALLDAGVEVAILEVPCYTPVDGGGLKALPERGDRARRDHLNELLRAVAADSPDVHMVTPPPEFCTDESIGGDLNLRWDGVHYGPRGGAFVWGRLQDQLLAIPVDYDAA